MSGPNPRKIGGSDIPAMCGLSSYSTPSQLARRLRTGINDDASSYIADVGLNLEDQALRWYESYTGVPVREHPPIEGPWWRASPDGEAMAPWGPHGVEVKIWDSTRRREFGDPNSNQVPPQLYLQCQWYMHWIGWDAMSCIVSFGTREPVLFHLESDPELQRRIVRLAESFYVRAMRDDPLTIPTVHQPEPAVERVDPDDLLPTADTTARARYLAKASRIEKLAKQRRELAKAWAIAHVGNQPGRIRVPGVTVSVYETKHGLGVRVRED